MEYVRICDGVRDVGKLIPHDEDIYKYIEANGSINKDWYRSVFIYDDKHLKQFKEKGSIAGITDVLTDRLVFDFDSKDNIELARKDTVELCSRLIAKGIPQNDIQICFSGNKGYSVEVITTSKFTPEEHKRLNLKLTEGLPTNDTSILNAARIFRVPQTKHNVSGLYKFPITLEQLSSVPSHDIKKLATDLNNVVTETDDEFRWNRVDVPDALMVLTEEPKKIEKPTLERYSGEAEDLDFKSKPKGFPNCKFAIMNGFFPPSTRNNALTALVATCRAQGYPKEISYNILKGAARLQSQKFEQEVFSKSEIWSIIQSTYSPSHKGGQFSCKNQPWLKEICDGLGPHKCKHDEERAFLEITDMSKDFEAYSKDIEKNTIKTGLKAIDENIQLTVGMPVGLLGAPGSGKTSLALDILSNTSANGVSSVFFSMDMYGPLVYMKQAQRHLGASNREIHHIFKHEQEKAAKIKEQIREEYKNVKFSLKSGYSVQEMRDIISAHQDHTGDKVKLILIDYLECIAGPYSDATANTSKIAGELKDFAVEMQVCGITLLQPPKSAGDASSPLTSMRQIKGSSMLEQSFRAILGIHREGFGPRNPEDDRFITISALKNTMGGLFHADYGWEGRTGRIFELGDEGERELSELRNRIASRKEAENSSQW